MKTKNKYQYLYILQGYYSYGWEDLTVSEIYKEVEQNKKEYQENECGHYRIIQRRVLNEN